MGKKVVVISTSIRANSNSQVLATSFAEGVKSSGNHEQGFECGCSSLGNSYLLL